MDLRFFEIYRSSEYLSLLLEGSFLSLWLTIFSGILGFLVAVTLVVVRYWQVPVLGKLATGFVEFTRNTPLIVQLFFVAFGLPALFGYRWPFWGHALLALTLNFSAYFSEILRAGVLSLGLGQSDAARSLGLSRWTTYRRVLLPQAVAVMYASLSSQFVFLFLTTAVIAEIGVRDLTYAGLFIDSRTFRTFEVFFTLTLIYLIMGLFFKTAFSQIGKRAFAWKQSS